MAARLLLIAFTFVAGLTPAIAHPPASDLRAEFAQPPQAAQPDVIWYWRNELHTREGITADLEAMHRVGIGGVEIGFIGGNTEPKGDVAVMSPKWRAMFVHAVAEAHRLGMRVNIFNSPGWSSTGGPWIKPELAMQKLAWREVRHKGPGRLAGRLEPPPASDPTGLAARFSREYLEKIQKPYYRDFAVLAFPTPPAEQAEPGAPSITCDDPGFDVRGATDGNPRSGARLTAKPARILFRYDRPFLPRSISVEFTPSSAVVPFVDVEASEDGNSWNVVRRCAVRNGAPVVNAPLKASPARFWRATLLSDGDSATPVVIAEIALRSGYRIEDWTAKAMFDNRGMSQPPFSAAESTPGTEASIPQDSILDLTRRLRADGTLDWDAPPGDWTIVRYGSILTLATNAPATPSGAGLESDKYNPAALDLHWKSFVAPLLQDPAFAQGLTCVHIDSYEKGAQNWSPCLPGEFTKRRGYDLVRFLPVMTGRVVGDLETSERFLWDLRKTLCDTMADNYYGHMAELCHRNGKLLSIEPYHQVQFDNMVVGGRADEVMSEFWLGSRPSRLYYKNAASPAHVYGKRIVSSEAFTAPPAAGGNWSTAPWDLKVEGDRAYAFGINRFVFHVYNQQPWLDKFPGIQVLWGQHMERTNTWFDLSYGWLRYLARCQHLLQQGTHVGDMLKAVGENSPSEGAVFPALPAGYDFDNVSPEAILTRLECRDGQFRLPISGACDDHSPSAVYSAVLVLPETDATMTAAMAQKLKRLVLDGTTLVGPPPRRSPTLAGQPREDQELRQTVAELWGGCNGKSVTEHALGAGRVVWGRPVAEVLERLKIPPDFSGPPGIEYAHRRKGTTEIYFLSNGTDDTKEAECRFRTAGLQPELWDPLNGQIRDLPEFRTADGRTTIPLRLGPRESFFIVFDKPPAHPGGNAAATNSPASSAIIDVAGPWEVAFDPQWGGPESVVFRTLEDWSRRPEPGIKYYSGKAVYRTQFDLAAGTPGSRIFLHLGTVHNLAEVHLNGSNLGVVWCDPWRVEITQAVKPEGNQLEIVVANLWVNRMIGDEQLPDDCQWTPEGPNGRFLTAFPRWLLENAPRPSGRYTFGTYKYWGKNDPLMPSGLLGPVRVMATK